VSRLPELTRRVRHLGAELRLTEHPGHARALAAAAVREGCATVVAVGGDGTVNEVAGALAGTGATLGILPAGSGNGLARHLGLYGSWSRALAILAAGHTRPLDAGRAAGHPFFAVAGLGFEALLAERFNQTRDRGLAAYALILLRSLQAAQAHPLRIHAAGQTWALPVLTLAVANASQYGGGARIAPRARTDDGLLNLCALPPLRLGNVLGLTWRLLTGRIERAPGVLCLQGTEFLIERPANGPLQTDGEVHPAGTTVRFTVAPGALRVLCPPE
jgi:YegS/Rv2252/BmrU family lipid kinase